MLVCISVFLLLCVLFSLCIVCFLSFVLSDLTSKDVHYVQLSPSLSLSLSTWLPEYRETHSNALGSRQHL